MSSTRSGVPSVETVEQRAQARLGDDELAVGVLDVARELGTAARRVDPDQHAARECRRAEPEHEVGHVLEHHADVERTPAARASRRAARCAKRRRSSR